MKFTFSWDTESWYARNSCEKWLLLILLSVSDYKRAYKN